MLRRGMRLKRFTTGKPVDFKMGESLVSRLKKKVGPNKWERLKMRVKKEMTPGIRSWKNKKNQRKGMD